MYATVIQRRVPWEPLALALGPAAIASFLVLAFDSPTRVLGVGAGILLCAWLFLSERYERNLVVLLLYLGLLDGYLRLRTGQSELTLVRDVLIWSMVAGGIVRIVVRREPIRLPPLGWLVLTFCALVLVQVANPNGGTIVHSLGGVRQHLQFVPLFFFGYLIVRTTGRLRVFVALLLLVGAVNGWVGTVQFSQTPQQVAQWGPGFEQRIAGTGDVSGRVFVDSTGVARVRPFGLGSDMGDGGRFGLIALGAALAALGLLFTRRRYLLAIPLVAGVLAAIITSQQRTVVLGAAMVAVAFAALALVGRKSVTALVGVVGGALILALVVGSLGSTAGLFDRYESIAPDQAFSSSYSYRSDDVADGLGYLTEYPLGAGLGSVGPAASVGGAPPPRGLNAEGQFNFLVIELGVPGLLAFLCLSLLVPLRAMARLRWIEDGETRLLVAAVIAPLVGILLMWFAGITSTNTALAGYFWFASGVLVYWSSRRRPELARAPA